MNNQIHDREAALAALGELRSMTLGHEVEAPSFVLCGTLAGKLAVTEVIFGQWLPDEYDRIHGRFPIKFDFHPAPDWARRIEEESHAVKKALETIFKDFRDKVDELLRPHRSIRPLMYNGNVIQKVWRMQ
ncbi:hypothetical protein LX36DRAFT_713311 [Colletotrichum falcatum]|nr:hypothetical protein LX36DRAFT_713311 [Colletotrichum falcatum]